MSAGKHRRFDRGPSSSAIENDFGVVDMVVLERSSRAVIVAVSSCPAPKNL